MATKSISKNITIKDKYFARSLVSALESASNKKSKKIVLEKKCREVKGEDIKKLFGDN